MKKESMYFFFKLKGSEVSVRSIGINLKSRRRKWEVCLNFMVVVEDLCRRKRVRIGDNLNK